jgi:SAM-dependent methyltransferase
MADKLKSLWTRFWLRNSKFSGRYDDLRRLYAVKDPWNLQSAKEQARFEATNALVRSLVPDCRSLLELGCGEGFQTARLLEVSRAVTSVDVSERAIARARAAYPSASFEVSKAEDIGSLFKGRRFDIVTAFEVLYYSDDASRVIGAVQELSDVLLVSNYIERAERLRGLFTGPGWTRLDDIVVEDTVWECHAWRKPG